MKNILFNCEGKISEITIELFRQLKATGIVITTKRLAYCRHSVSPLNHIILDSARTTRCDLFY